MGKRLLLGLACSVAVFLASASVAAADTVVADNGFRPDPNGFSFENYGNDAGYQNLTAAEMEKLFGRAVCANSATRPTPEPAPAPVPPSGPSKPSRPHHPTNPDEGGVDSAGDAAAGGCSLTPPAQQWMDEQNRSMGGGHCNGFAVLSEELYKHQFASLGSGSPYSYQINGNPTLQHSIAYAFVYQVLDSVVAKRIKGTPNDILAVLAESLTTANPETYTLGIYKPDGSGGHAITPFAVVRHSASQYGVLVYDNNYHGETREVQFDTSKNQWSYNAAINPSVAPELYTGNASNPGIELDPTTPGEGVQPCPFCQAGGSASAAAAAPRLDTIQLTGSVHYHAHLVIRDGRGHQVGVIGGRIVNTFPGAQVAPNLALNDYSETQEPNYLVPDGARSVTVDATRLARPDTETLSSVGPGHDIALQNLNIAHGQRDVLNMNNGMSQLTFTADRGRSPGSPILRIGANGSKADIAIKLKLVSFRSGATLHVKLNTAKQTITFWSTGNSGRATYVLSAVKETRRADFVERAETIHVQGNQVVAFNYTR